MSNPSERGVSRVIHHKDYYLGSGDITLLVEHHLYRVHSYFFERESLFFRQMLAGSRESAEKRGSDDTNAYTLENTKSEDFARFLWVFYNPKYSLYEAPLDTWLSILGLAVEWGFHNVKELCVRELENLAIEPVEKISIYHKYSISRLYLIPSYVAVVRRDKPVSLPEGMKLGMETVLRIADARERARQLTSETSIRTPTFDDFDEAQLDALVRDVFSLSRTTSPPPGSSTAANSTGAFTSPNGTEPTIKLGNPPQGHQRSGSASNKTNGGSNSFGSFQSFATAMDPQVPQRQGTGSTAGTSTEPTAPVPPTKQQAGTGPTGSTPNSAHQPPQAGDNEAGNSSGAPTNGNAAKSPTNPLKGEPSTLTGLNSKDSNPSVPPPKAKNDDLVDMENGSDSENSTPEGAGAGKGTEKQDADAKSEEGDASKPEQSKVPEGNGENKKSEKTEDGKSGARNKGNHNNHNNNNNNSNKSSGGKGQKGGHHGQKRA